LHSGAASVTTSFTCCDNAVPDDAMAAMVVFDATLTQDELEGEEKRVDEEELLLDAASRS
jgi:hypothetical protein